tara:strand:- start:381 stop:3140 length:2760 start_codon:yes stop_codon:yes gene_type:complete
MLAMIQATGPDVPTKLGYGGARGAAKALDLDTDIPTPSGWSKLRDLRKGDWVFSSDGSPTQIIAETEEFLSRRSMDVKFSDGNSIVCDQDHLWLTWSHSERSSLAHQNDEWRAARRARRPSRSKGTRPYQAKLLAEKNRLNPTKTKPLPTGTICTAIEILRTLKVNKNHEVNHAVTLCGQLDLPNQTLPIDPYVLGAWLGDGHSAGGSITCADPEITDEIGRRGFTVVRNKAKYLWGIHGLHVLLRTNNLIKNKHIPLQYLRGSATQRLDLIRGLMDTDGTASKRNGYCSFTSTKACIASGCLELCLSLGIKATMTEGIARLYGKDISPVWKVQFNTKHQVFNLTRKRKLQKTDGFNPVSTLRYIVAVEDVAPRLMKCIQVAHPSGMFLAGRAFIPTHNSRILRDAMILRRFQHPQTTGFIIRRNWGDLEENHLERFRLERPGLMQYYSNVRQAFEFPNGSRIAFRYADTTDEVRAISRGPEAMDIAIDQCEQFTGQELALLTTPNRWPGAGPGDCKTWFFFNVGDRGADYLRRVFWLRQFEGYERPSDFDFILAYGFDNYEWFRNEMDISFDDFYDLPGDIPPPGKEERYDQEWLASIPDNNRFKMFVTRTTYGQNMWQQPEAIRMGDLFGDFTKFSGQYFAGVWQESKLVISPTLSEEIVKPWWVHWGSIDWGFKHSAAALVAATGKLSPKEFKAFFGKDIHFPIDVVVIKKEHVAAGVGEGDFCQQLADSLTNTEKKMLGEIWLSPDAWQKRGSQNTIAEQMEGVLRRNQLPRPERADDDRMGGWRLMWNCMKQTCSMRSEVPDIYPGGFPMLLISAECAQLISGIPMLIYNEKQAGRSEDILKTDTTYDDVCDSARYLLASKLNPTDNVPRSVRAREVLDSAGEHPNAKAMAMRIFDEKEKQRHAAVSRPRWRPS